MLAVQQCGQDADHAVHAGTRVADLGAGHRGRTVLGTRRAGRAAHALGHVFVRLAVRVRPRAEALDRRVDQARVQLLQAVPVETSAIEHAGAEVLHQHVAALHQVFQQRLALGRLHVQRQAALVGVQHREVEAVGVRHVAQLAARDVTASGQFDLDHVGAQPGHQLGGRGAGLHVRHVQDADTIQCFVIHGVVSLKILLRACWITYVIYHATTRRKCSAVQTFHSASQ
ncbi:hypothetical protein D3C72_1210480 [compost metagenome]